ncbi:endo-beta-N-acetylglucosaminidase H [Nakamurella sp. A5-74]|uniref:Endo-beta-N-acetylglucosaminidase H n=1 Tax=Nakamurella sp. A5-74 TaxID=3158264 RepID=A0AAU8DQS7_9ACTN
MRSHTEQGRFTRRAVLTGALGAAGSLVFAGAADASGKPGRGKESGNGEGRGRGRGHRQCDPRAVATDPISVAYVEVNNEDPINVGRYRLADGRQLFAIGILFAANINASTTTSSGTALVCNERMQQTLDEASTQIRPLQAKGTKVLLSVLGNHQGVGLANFQTYRAADDFARQVMTVVNRYGLDGVDLDDEYSDYGANGTPQPNDDSIGWLITALRKRMPDKLITFYDIGPSSDSLRTADPSIGAKLDYAWNPYYGAYNPPSIPGLGKESEGAAAIDWQSTSAATAASLATRTDTDGFGVYLTYNLDDVDRSGYANSFTQPLYGQDTVFH